MGAGYPFGIDNWQDPSDASKNTGKRLRGALGLLWFGHRVNRLLGARSGLPAGMGAVVTATSSTWTVIEHGGVIDAETSATAGPVPYTFDTPQTGGMNAPHATLDRIDLISVQISDPTQDASSTPGVAVVYTAGTAASSPSAPATPARSLAIAQVRVPSAASGNPPVVTMVAPWTVAVGGILPTRSSSERPDATSGAYIGQVVDDAALGLLRFNGADWTPPSSFRVGSASFGTNLVTSGSGTTEGVGYSQSVTLIAGRRYRVWFRVWLNATAGNRAAVKIRYASGTVTSSSTQAGDTVSFYIPASGSVGRSTGTGFVEFTVPTTGVYNVAMGVLTTVGSGDTTVVGTEQATLISIDDIGV